MMKVMMTIDVVRNSYMYMLKEMKGRYGHPFLSGYLHHVISYDAKKQWV